MNVLGQRLEAVVDTGFNGHILLPQRVIRDLGLMMIATRQHMTAGGEVSENSVFEAQIIWLGKKRTVSVIAGSTDLTLIGMGLLHNARVVLEPSKGILEIGLA